MQTRRPRLPATAARRRGFAPVRAGMLAALVAASPLPGATEDAAAGALPVETVVVRAAGHYTIEREYVGRVEATRTTEAGFEIAGRIDALNVDEGDTVAAGDVLATLDIARLAAERREHEASRREARARRDLARTTLERTEAAHRFDGASRQALDEARQALASAEAAVELASARIARVEVAIDQATLRAPFAAVVTRRHADEGHVAAAGEPVVTLQASGPRTARIGVTGRAADALAVGEVRSLRVEGETVAGTVRAVLPVRRAGARTVDVLVDLPGTAARPGDLAILPMAQRVAARGFWLPTDALTSGERGLWTAHVAAPDGAGGARVIRPRQLTVLHAAGDRVYAQGALDSGDRIVASGRHRVVPGQRVTLAEDTERLAGRETR